MPAINRNTELGKLLDKTSMAKPKPADQQALRAYLAENGTAEMVKIGNLTNEVILQVINVSFAGNWSYQIAAQVKIDAIKAELGYESAKPVERLMIEAAALAWLRYHVVELCYEQARRDTTMAQMEHWEKRLSAAHRRYLRSLEGLARIRRLLEPRPSPITNILLKQQLGLAR